MKVCPSCGTPLDEGEDVRFCPECGASLSDVQDASPFVAGGTMPMGGGVAQQGASPQTQQMPQVPITPQPASGAAVAQGGTNKTAIIVAVAAVVAIVVIALLAFLLLRPQGSAEAKYSIQFETDGGTAIASTQAEEGTLVTSPANPTKDGYEFVGWFADAGRTQQVAFPFEADKNVVLYAKWTEKEEEPAPVASTAAPAAEPAPPVVNTTPQANTSSTVRVSIVGADGSTRTADIRRQGSTQRVLPDSNTRRYSASETIGLSDAERCIAWNEIIAASNGYVFKNSGLKSYFNNCSWYRPVSGASGSGSLSAEASANVELLKSQTDSWWTNLATY